MANDDFFGFGKIPVEPNAETRQGMASIFAMYTAAIQAGFDPQQALQITIAIVTKAI